jgi:RNA polymerase sigma-70 factor (ECF subfamily)
MRLPDEPHLDRVGEDESALPHGASERFTALLVRHQPALMGYILSLVPSWPDAEDLLQQTSVVMWRKFGEFREGSDFLSWGCQIARFHTLNHVRKRTRDRHVFSPDLLETLAEEGALDVEQLDAERVALRLCLEKLDPRSRNLLGHCYQPDATVRAVAEYLGRTPNSVYKGLNRIREALLRCIRRTLAREGA